MAGPECVPFVAGPELTQHLAAGTWILWSGFREFHSTLEMVNHEVQKDIYTNYAAKNLFASACLKLISCIPITSFGQKKVATER